MMDAAEFQTLAIRLCAGSQPAELRSATSRAYYAAFHTALGFLRSIGISIPSSPEFHTKVCYALENSGDSEVSIAGRKLTSLRRERNISDYDLSKMKAEDKQVVGNNVRSANDVIDCINRCIAGGPKAGVHPAIRKYAKDVLGLIVT